MRDPATPPAAPAGPSARDALSTPPVAQPPATPPLDAHGFDPDDFEWRPVPRRPRADGWSPDVQRRFVEALADTGLVSAACEAVDMSVASAYRLRRAPGAESFARAWDAALDAAADHLAAVAFSRALEGVDVPVFDRNGCRIGARRQYNDRLLMFLLRAYRPERFGGVERPRAPAPAQPAEPRPAASRPADPVAAPTAALAQATAALFPVPPAEPHRLMPPEKLHAALDGAAAMGDLYRTYPEFDREHFVRPRVEADGAEARAYRPGPAPREFWE
ncbi:hypothetical protein [Sphingomonas sp. 3-13AW]|uniref:hypothetical protein n=1 Tax=Sphingomonas sp. 3-13AW TaxID=3050450 RepID=UPI003BB4A1D6